MMMLNYKEIIFIGFVLVVCLVGVVYQIKKKE